jgi:hypothetical protein
VDKVNVLSAMNEFMMQEFSRRTVVGLKQYTLFNLLLPAFQSFLEINVSKEVEKDRLVISCAAAAQRAGRKPDDTDSKRLLQQAREIDRTFLQRASFFPISIDISYGEIEEFRRARFDQLLEASHGLLAQWEAVPRFRLAVAGLYTQEQFKDRLREILRLYGMETKMLSRSVKIPQALAIARDSLAETVYSVMEDAAEDLAREFANRTFRRISRSGEM